MRTTRQIAELIVGSTDAAPADVTASREVYRTIAIQAAQLAYREASERLIEAAADLNTGGSTWNVEYLRGQVELIANAGLPNPVGLTGLDHDENKHLIENLIRQTAREADL